MVRRQIFAVDNRNTAIAKNRGVSHYADIYRSLGY